MNEFTWGTEMALTMYTNEPCRICRQNISKKDVHDGIVFAGYSDDNTSRAAHERCWQGMIEVARAYHDKYGHPAYQRLVGEVK